MLGIRQTLFRTVAVSLVALIFLLETGSAAFAESYHRGIVEYEVACMPCHGVDGRGDGPLAKSVAHRPELEAFHDRKITLERQPGGARFITDIHLTRRPSRSRSIRRLIKPWLRRRRRASRKSRAA